MMGYIICTFSCLFLVSFVLTENAASTVDYSAEAIKFLNLEGIKEPSPNEKKLAKKLVAKDEDLKKSEREKGGIEKEKDAAFKLAETAGVFAYLRSLLEVYEWLLDNTEGKSPKVTDEELEQLGLPVGLTDRAVKNSLRTHYGKWLGILGNDADPRIEQFKSQILPKLGFTDNKHFAKYTALLFCMLSNIGHNFPQSMINFSNEEKVITALKNWNIEDPMILNTARAFYQLVRLPVPSTTTTSTTMTTSASKND